MHRTFFELMRPLLLHVVSSLVLFFLLFLAPFLPQITKGRAVAGESVIVGSKDFTEGYILGEIVSLLLEEVLDQPVQRKLGLGGTQVAFSALNKGDIHVYPEYTGTGYTATLGMEGETRSSEVYQIVLRLFKDRWEIQWSKPIGFNNTYSLAVRKDDSFFEGVQSLSDLSSLDLAGKKYAAGHEFMERQDGHSQLMKMYNINLASEDIVSLDAGLMYAALRDRVVDIIVSYSTDGRIRAYELRLLKDDQSFFPPYDAALIAKEKDLKNFPSLQKVFELMDGLVNESEMIYMNDQVDRLKREPADVARSFLEKKGFLKSPLKGPEVNSMKGGGGWSDLYLTFIHKKSYIFSRIIEHIYLSFGALALSFLVSLPLGILLTRYQGVGNLVFPIINTIQTIPSLALLGFFIPFLGIGFVPAVLTLFLYSLLPLIRNTYAGVLGVHKSYIDASRGIGLTDLQTLLRIEIPIALPVILAGLRTSAVIVIGTTTLVALIGAGGLGDPIFRGISTLNSNLILMGAIPVAILAVLVDKSIGLLEKIFISRGLRLIHRQD